MLKADIENDLDDDIAKRMQLLKDAESEDAPSLMAA